jgi:hypothetical protein
LISNRGAMALSLGMGEMRTGRAAGWLVAMAFALVLVLGPSSASAHAGHEHGAASRAPAAHVEMDASSSNLVADHAMAATSQFTVITGVAAVHDVEARPGDIGGAAKYCPCASSCGSCCAASGCCAALVWPVSFAQPYFIPVAYDLAAHDASSGANIVPLPRPPNASSPL